MITSVTRGNGLIIVTVSVGSGTKIYTFVDFGLPEVDKIIENFTKYKPEPYIYPLEEVYSYNRTTIGETSIEIKSAASRILIYINHTIKYYRYRDRAVVMHPSYTFTAQECTLYPLRKSWVFIVGMAYMVVHPVLLNNKLVGRDDVSKFSNFVGYRDNNQRLEYSGYSVGLFDARSKLLYI